MPFFSYVMSNYSHPDLSLSLDANGDTAPVTSSESTEANSDSKADLGMCTLYVTGLFIDLYSIAKELQCCYHLIPKLQHMRGEKPLRLVSMTSFQDKSIPVNS